MPGKKPKERQRYMLRINDTLVEVTREVYLAWYQAGRKERYQVEKMQRHGVCSMEELQEKGYDCSFSVVSPEEIVIRLSEIQELEEALGYLTKEDAELITLLFFEEFTVKETAQYFGPCSILTELRSYMIWKDTAKRKMCFAAFRPSIRRLMRCANPCGLKF